MGGAVADGGACFDGGAGFIEGGGGGGSKRIVGTVPKVVLVSVEKVEVGQSVVLVSSVEKGATMKTGEWLVTMVENAAAVDLGVSMLRFLVESAARMVMIWKVKEVVICKLLVPMVALVWMEVVAVVELLALMVTLVDSMVEEAGATM